jgi:hypothetical protein
MNWFASNMFRSQWFASRWFASVTIPVIPSVICVGGMGGGGSWGSIRRPRLIQVNLPGLFAGRSSRRKNSTPVISRTFQGNTGMFSTPARRGRSRKKHHPATAQTSVTMSGAETNHPGIRHLDQYLDLRTPVPGNPTECSCSRYPVRMRDASGEFDVIQASCNIRRGGRVVRHLG